jgi:hypothetical protein
MMKQEAGGSKQGKRVATQGGMSQGWDGFGPARFLKKNGK